MRRRLLGRFVCAVLITFASLYALTVYKKTRKKRKRKKKNGRKEGETGCRFHYAEPVMYGAKRRRQLSIVFTCAPNGSRRLQTTVTPCASSPARNPSIDCTCRCTANSTTPTINDSTNALFASRVFVHCRRDTAFSSCESLLPFVSSYRACIAFFSSLFFPFLSHFILFQFTGLK